MGLQCRAPSGVHRNVAGKKNSRFEFKNKPPSVQMRNALSRETCHRAPDAVGGNDARAPPVGATPDHRLELRAGHMVFIETRQ